MKESTLCLFALRESRDLGERIAAHCHLVLSDHEEREFDDGEHKTRPLNSVRGLNVAVIHSLNSEKIKAQTISFVGYYFSLAH
jgi:ribose-phosphate pyrophosphokinase